MCAEGVKGEDEKNGGRGARRKIKVNFVLSSLRLLTMGMTMALCVVEMLTGVKVHHIKSIKEKKKHKQKTRKFPIQICRPLFISKNPAWAQFQFKHILTVKDKT